MVYLQPYHLVKFFLFISGGLLGYTKKINLYSVITRVFFLFPAPRPVVVVSDVQSRKAVLHVRDPSPTETVQYLVRYKTYPRYSTWIKERRNKTGHGADTWIVLHNIHPYSSYTVEVASYYKDDDVGPYSVNKHFTTKQAG